MKTFKRGRYNTMNSWNNATAPAYNLKVYNVVDDGLQDKVYKLMEAENFYDDINYLISEFGESSNYEYQAGFNGRSGGYLVLYKGGKKESEYKSICLECGQKNFTSIKENDDICGKCGAEARIHESFFEVYTMAGQSIEEGEAPGEVLKRFRKLAVDIVKSVEELAKSDFNIEEVSSGETVKIIN